MGDICRAEGDLAAARGCYERSLAIREALAEETATVEVRRDLSISYDRLGDICSAEGDLAAARGYYERSLAIREALTEKTGTVEARRDLSISCNKLGNICRAEGDLAAARGYYERSLAISEALTEKTGTVEARRNLSVNCNNLGNICRAEGDLAASRDYYERGIVIAEDLIKKCDLPSDRYFLALIHNNYSSVFPEKDRITHLRTAAKIMGELVATFPDNTEYRDLQAKVYHNIQPMAHVADKTQKKCRELKQRIEVLRNVDNLPKAQEVCLELYRYMCEAKGEEDPMSLDAQSLLLDVLLEKEDFQGAVDAAEKLFALRCKVLGVDHKDTQKTRKQLASLYRKTGDSQKAAALRKKQKHGKAGFFSCIFRKQKQ